MDRRTLFIMIAASWILVIFMVFNAPKPKKADEQGPDSVAENSDQQKKPDEAGSKKDEEKKSAEDNAGTDEPSKRKTGDEQGPGSPAGNPEDTTKKEKASGPDGSQTGDSGKASTQPPKTDKQDQAAEPTDRPVIPQQFISVGSLAKDSPYRFLVTFDNRAASIHRLELVQRIRKTDRLKYKDLEIRHGYLGHLELEDLESGGCRVRTVGRGTPAATAGIHLDDVIKSFDGQPVNNRVEFKELLEKTKPGRDVELGLQRAGADMTVTLTLMRHPLEVIRPNIVPEIAQFAFANVETRKSYAVSIFEPVGNEWKKLGAAHEAIWEHESGDDFVKFYYPCRDEEEAKKQGFNYQVIKTFRLVPVADEDRDDITSRNYHLDFDVQLKNLGSEPKSYAYRVDGPNGLPTEDWWFAIKIHGEWSAVFTQAGARDIVASTTAKSFHFIGGPKIYTNGTKANAKDRLPLYVIDPRQENAKAHLLKYIGVDSHYFVSTLIPTDGESNVARQAYSAYALPQYVRLADPDTGKVNPQRRKEAKWYRKLVPVNFKAYFIFEGNDSDDLAERRQIAPGQTVSHSFVIFAGPKEPGLLKNYAIDDTVTYGWFAAFSWPLVKLLHLFYSIIGNYAIAIVLLTVLVRLAMMRFSRKMVLNTQMMQLLAPEIKAIAEKHKDDFQAKSRAQQELFRKYKYNPFSGCLVMLIQLPVFIGLYRGLSVDIALRDQPLIPGISWCSNLAGPDQLWKWQETLPSFFSFLTHETGWLGPYFNLLPIISVVLMLVQQKMFTPPPTDEQQAMMQKVMSFMMIFIGIVFFKVPAGLCIYFITSTLWAVLEKKMIPPPKLPEHLQQRLDELKALQEKERADGVEPGTYTNVKTTAGGNATRKHTERAKKRSQKNRRK